VLPDPVGLGSLRGARIVLGVSGGIAAYKAIEVCRLLFDAGAHVMPVLTDDALRFVGALTFSALASEPARVSMWDGPEPSPHTHLGKTADLILVVPATANTLASYAAGLSNNLLTSTLLATAAPVVVCPAMHTEMYEHPSVGDNLALLKARGVHVVDPGVGMLASGDFGAGRLADPASIIARAASVLAPTRDLAGRSVVVSAGGTREAIDPVRFIGNRSSGKQGYSMAEEAWARGAAVTLVTTVHRPVSPGITVESVESAAEMAAAMTRLANTADVIVMAAAVADFRPVNPAERKIKKSNDPAQLNDAPSVTLERTPDILAGLGAAKRHGQVIVGFAAETHDLRENALEKLRRKGADMIVANDVTAAGRGFESETNEVTIFLTDGGEHHVELSSKRAVARAVIDLVVSLLS
jgi:phosphopantothenoylcysteine decarboxylase / phosphopantothenate---cysteine ligase